MARSRVYRHDVRCSDCGSNWMRRDGCTNGKQAFRLPEKAGTTCFPMGSEQLHVNLQDLLMIAGRTGAPLTARRSDHADGQIAPGCHDPGR